MMSTNNSAAVDELEEVIDLTHPQTSQSDDQRVSSFPSDVRTPLLTSSFQDRSQITSVMDVKETKWLPKTSVIGIMRGSASVMYHVCSRMMAESLKSHNSLVISMLETSEDGVLHVIRGQTSSQVLSQLVYRFKANGNWDGSVPFLESGEIMQKRRYKCVGVKHCVLVPPSFSGRSHGNSETFEHLLSEQRERRDGSTSAQQTAKRLARTLFLSVQKKVNSAGGYCQYIRPPTLSQGAPRVVQKCRGVPKLRTNRSTGEYFLGCSGFRRGDGDKHSSAEGWASRKHSSQSLHALTDEALVELQEMLHSGKVADCSKEKCMFFLSKGKKTTQCPDHGTSLIETGACPVNIILMQPVGQASCDTAVYKRGDILRGLPREQNTICFAYFQGIHNHPPPPPLYPLSRRILSLLRNLASQEEPPQPTSNWRFRKN